MIFYFMKVYTIYSAIMCSVFAMSSSLFVQKNICHVAREGEFVKDPYSCEKFFQCRNGIGIPVFCPTGMYFDGNAQICEIAHRVHCIPEQYPTEMPIDEVTCPHEDKNEVVFVASKYDCHRYFICYHGNAIQQDCIPELHWNKRWNRCDFPENANCKINQLPRCPENGTQILPHPTECDYFIYCINGFASLQQCPFYHQWDGQMKKCVLKNQRSKCVKNY